MNTITTDTVGATMPFSVRPLRELDIPQVKAIEKQAFATLFPPTSFRRELGNKAASYWVAEKREVAAEPAAPVAASISSEPRAGVVQRALGRATGLWTRRRDDEASRSDVVGFLGTWYAADEAHVVSVGVGDDYRRRGIGELLLIVAVEHAIARQTETMTLEVRRSNGAAQSLYEKYGFIEHGIRKAYYTDNREDAVIMTTGSIQTTQYAERIAVLKRAHGERWGRAKIDLGA